MRPDEVFGFPMLSTGSPVINGTDSGGIKDEDDRGTGVSGWDEADGFLRDFFSLDGWQPMEGNWLVHITDGARYQYRIEPLFAA